MEGLFQGGWIDPGKLKWLASTVNCAASILYTQVAGAQSTGPRVVIRPPVLRLLHQLHQSTVDHRDLSGEE